MSGGSGVLFFAWRPMVNASTRYRVYTYLPSIKNAGIAYKVCPPSSETLFNGWYRSKKRLKKALYLLVSLVTRWYQVLWLSRRYRVVFIQRELFPVGPPILEWVLHRSGKKILYDFDDAVFLKPPYVSSGLRAWIHCYAKVERILGWSSVVIAGNRFLADYARRYSKNVHIIPTVPDRVEVARVGGEERLVIGWSGTAGNLVHLRSVSDALAELKRQFADLEIRVVSDGHFSDPRFDTINHEWRMDVEAALMSRFTIGIAPLLDTPYSKGKCGFKVLRYMAAGVPVVCSSVGVHNEMIRDGENGYLCRNHAEWVEKTSRLLKDRQLRDRFRTEGFRTLESNYSFDECAERFAEIVEDLVREWRMRP